ncbi:hypothetical protein RASY3_01545 [Ruminococcus albus SY3]|uniref:Uncharacterized protein n=2 Tax=Ruminococcus albus TaxID=1264 RepID=A0A011UJZ2_RUMAL|nr:hypothetical protein RASY3_01545 [Ruminococcus albus SY3]
MTMTEIRGRLGIELADKRLAEAVLSRLAYRVPHRLFVAEDGSCECPVCGHEFGNNVDDVSAYCPDCGQELDKENGYGE